MECAARRREGGREIETTMTNMAIFRFTFTTHEHGQIFFIFRTMVFG